MEIKMNSFTEDEEKSTYLGFDLSTQKAYNLMEESLEEIIKNIEKAEARWKALLEEGEDPANKPAILSVGPRPKKIKKQQTKNEGALRALEYHQTYATGEELI